MCRVPRYPWSNKVYSLLDLCESWCTSTKPSAFWDKDFKCNYDILCVVSTVPFDKKCHPEDETFVLFESKAMKLLWEYTVHDSVCKSSFPSLKIVKSSAFLLKCCTTSLYTIKTVIFSCFAACLPATVLNDLLRDKFLVMQLSETVLQDAHTKFLLVLSSVHHVQTRIWTYYKNFAHGSLDWWS